MTEFDDSTVLRLIREDVMRMLGDRLETMKPDEAVEAIAGLVRELLPGFGKEHLAESHAAPMFDEDGEYVGLQEPVHRTRPHVEHTGRIVIHIRDLGEIRTSVFVRKRTVKVREGD